MRPDILSGLDGPNCLQMLSADDTVARLIEKRSSDYLLTLAMLYTPTRFCLTILQLWVEYCGSRPADF